MSTSLHFGYTFIFVPDVPAALSFYKKAFNLEPGYIGAENKYAELVIAGGTKLAFVNEEFFRQTGQDIASNGLEKSAPGLAIAFTTPDVAGTFKHAVANGAVTVKEPAEKPWGQTVCYIRDLNGVLVEICSPMGN